MNNRTLLGALAAGFLLAAAAAPTQAKTPSMTATGVVRAIDTAHRSVTIAGSAIAAMGMPAMTMPYTVRRKSLLAGLHIGEKIRYTLGRHGGAMLVDTIEPLAAH